MGTIGRRTRAAIGAALVLPLVLLGCSGSAGDDVGRARVGPVTFDLGGGRVVSGMRASAGERVIHGAATVTNAGDEPAVLRAGDMLGSVDPADAGVIDVRVVDLGPAPGAGDLLGAAPWPTPGWRRWWRSAVPVEEAELPAGGTAEIIYLIEVRRTGQWLWPQSALDYEVGGTAYRAVADVGFEVCPPGPACTR
ncbi:hypothetical protein GGQ22_00180 [Nocardioides sp. zg-579]|uniref:DUF4352 domain-containing protein n=1 Tax=Nocardioides marmotae TaxID=2663857 RepID=A0A6I3J041_9ACTN|nr:hypothetical protein [Nocardioides marmotae]MCR6029856.1 hypothetical protein [Gordonia jinghuaiqii]MTB93486.1 hypothetical protein [Nocardioides marmotae]QKD99867.1 hypothetical protein HPC71_01250 [Nocardioides marmotae]